jgi:hypothetical protein
MEYAANVLASMPFREASIAARGLLYTLRLECWVNGQVPSDPKRLCRVLGLQDDLAPLLPEIASFFDIDGEHMTCIDIELYRAEAKARQEKLSAGGKAGADKTNFNRKITGAATPSANPSATPSATPSTTPSGSRRPLRLDQVNLDQVNSIQTQSLEGGSTYKDFVDEYESHEA